MIPGLFVTATDTGAGKTLVTCALLRMLRQHGVDAVGFKPMATGEVAGRWHDVDALFEASGEVEPREHICPMRYGAPMAPVQAAKLEGIDPDISLARMAFAQLAGRHALVVAEGIGGLLVPLDRRTLVLDFIAMTRFPVVVVTRAQLGTVNHTLLTLRELERARVPVAAVVLNITRAEDTPNAAPSAEEIERHAGRKVDAVIPYLGAAPDPEAPHTELVARAIASLSAQLNVMRLAGR